MNKKNEKNSLIWPILKAVFLIAFFIVLPINAESTYCHKGALIHLSYNANVEKSVWTQGVGSNYSYTEQGYNSLSDATWYIDGLETMGYKYSQCSSQINPTPTPIQDTQGYNCNSNSCVYTTSNAQYKASDFGSLGSAYNICLNQCRYTPPVPVSTAGYNCNYGSCTYVSNGAQYKVTDYQNDITSAYNACNRACQYTPPTPVNTAGYSCSNNSCTYTTSNAQYRIADYQNNATNAYNACYSQCSYIPPTPTYTYPEAKTISINYDSTNDQLNSYGYLANLGNDTYAKTGFCLFEKNYGYSCNTEITGNNAQYSLGQFSNANYSTLNLKRNTQYCIRAYAQNSYGRRLANSYEDQCFYTRSDYYQPPYQPPYQYGYKPTIRTTGVDYYPTNLATTFKGYVDNIGSYTTARVGFCLYKQQSGFTCEQDLTVDYSRKYNGEFVYYNFPGNTLLTNTTYCIRAYGENQAGRQYSEAYLDKCFSTNQWPAPYPNPQTNITVTKTAVNGVECQTADVTITINCSSYSCSNVVVYDALPSNINFVYGSANPTVSYFWPNKGQQNKTLVWSLGNLSNGYKTIKYRVRFNNTGSNQLIADYPDSKLTYNDNGVQTKQFPQIYLNPVSCQTTPPPQPEPLPTCSYFENALKDKFEYCGKMGYQNICFNGKTKTFLTCANDANLCLQRYSYVNGVNCLISSNYNNYTIRNTSLNIYGNNYLTANGYLYAGQGRAETGFAIYEKSNSANMQYFTANTNQTSGLITKNINIAEIGGFGKQYCSKAYYIKDGQKTFSPEEKCYTVGGCYKGVIIYPIQNTNTNIFWSRLPEYVRSNTFTEMQQIIDAKISTGKTFAQCNY
jgi:hypothetical protein